MKKIFVVILSLLGSVSLAHATVITLPTDWWSNQTDNLNVLQNGVEELRLSNFSSGFIEGVVALPHEATWSIAFGVRTDGNFDLPTEFVEINFNSVIVSKIFNTPISTIHPVSHSFFGNELTYRFDFSSPVANIGAHLIVEAGEISTIPVPGAAWLLGSGFLSLIALARRKARV